MTAVTELKGEPLLILLIEDNEDHAELMRRSLSHHRVANKIIHISDGQKAMDYLFRSNGFADPQTSPRPHLVILDLRLPRIDGLSLLKAMKEDPELHQIPVVVVTSSDREADIARAYDYHANSYLVKPIDFQKFQTMMNELGFYWLGWNTNPEFDTM
jgi:CheY-like chemotaxis protein